MTYQKTTKGNVNPTCPLCSLTSEVPYYEDDFIAIVRTKTMKGHQERLMVIWKDHVISIPTVQETYAILKLIEVGKRQFNYTYKFVIMEGTYQTIKNHFHLVATDLDPKSDDFWQIMKTPWIEVVDTDY